jgi:hypothetical protein
VKIKIGNLQLSFSGYPPLSKSDEKCWGHCVSLGNGEVMVWINPLTAVDDKWLETLIHELMHAVEHATGQKLPHRHIKLFSVFMTSALIVSGLIDPAEVRKRFEAATEAPQIWAGEKDE